MLNRFILLGLTSSLLISCGSEIDASKSNGEPGDEERIVTIESPKSILDTDKTNYPVSGSCSHPGEPVTVTINGVVKAEANCQNNKKFNAVADVSSISDGTDISIEAEHGSTNKSKSEKKTVVKDTVPANLSVDTPPPANLNNSNMGSYSTTGTCDEEGATITVEFGGISETTTCSGGSYSFSGVDFTGASDVIGANFTITITDSAGNETVDTTVVTKDSVAPTVTVNLNPINIANNAAYIVTGDCDEEGGTVNLNVNGSSVTATCTSGSYSTIPLNLSGDGDTATYPITADIDDSAGNSATQASVNVVKDTVAPTIVITGVDSSNAGFAALTTVNGTCNKSGATLTARVDGVNSIVSNLSCDGTNFTGTMSTGLAAIGASFDVSIQITDAAGNTATSGNESLTKTDLILDPNATASEKFSDRVNINGNLMVVGNTASGFSTVYVYRKTNGEWIPDGTITYAGADSVNNFGDSVETDGTKIVIGAPNEDTGATNSGSVFVYAHNGTTWVLEQELSPTDTATGDAFGWKTALDGNRLAVSAWKKDSNTGGVYIYEFDGSTWGSETKILPSDTASGQYFGSGVALEDNRLVVGAQHRDGLFEMRTGGVYIYEHDGSTWGSEVILAPSTEILNGAFGYDVSLDGNNLAVSYEKDLGVYFYQYDGSSWDSGVKIAAAGLEANDYFARTIELSGNYLVVGAPGDDQVGNSRSDSGAAYIFTYDGTNWSEDSVIRDEQGLDNVWFGNKVSLNGSEAVIGGAVGVHPGQARFVKLP